ncbi:MAG: LysE/ArgO family amino acid transporter [Coriobacteriia bacterium]
MTANLAVAASGFALGASLIIAIGAQNAFVLRQGLLRHHVFPVAATCALIDAALISLGAGGFGRLVSAHPTATAIAAWGGVAFLAIYGGRSFLAALKPSALRAEDNATSAASSLGTVLAATLAVSLLNPHVYLDTVVLLGSIAAQYPAPSRLFFALGAMSASGVWFFSLAYGARLLAPLFERPIAWRVLDVVVGIVMWWVAGSLVWGQLAA